MNVICTYLTDIIDICVNIEKESSITLSNCLYARNTMSSHFVALHNSNITITDSQFINNTVSSNGGIVVAKYCSVAISGSKFGGNIEKILQIKQGAVNVEGSIFDCYSAQNENLLSVESSRHEFCKLFLHPE